MATFDQDPERARELGRQGGHVSGQVRRRRLTLEDVERELGALATPQDAQRWLSTVVQWAAAGLVSGTVAVGCASLLREWVKAYDTERLQGRLRELEREVATLRPGGPRG